MDLTGYTFQGRFDVLERISEDETTETYSAKHQLLDAEFRIKIMKPHAIVLTMEVKGFQIEMQSLAQRPSDKEGLAVDFSILPDGRPFAILLPPGKVVIP